MTTLPSGSGLDAELARALVQAQDLCARLAAERSEAQREAAQARARAAELEGSIAFGLGSLLLAARSPKGLIALPKALAGLARHWRQRGRGGTTPAPGPATDAVELPGAELVRAWHLSRRPAPPENLAGLRVAAVVDEFTEACFTTDCRLLNLSVADVEQQLDGFQPHLLFVESAWRGRAGGWMHKVCPCSGELRRLVDTCRRRGIPTVFWNKEDPGHFDNFVDAAGLFDHVFTTDADCVERYRESLGHDRVGVLGFACQPAIHNPVEVGVRSAAASFAGSWYARYPERARDFEALVAAVEPVVPVEIYDRNHDRDDPAFAYPAKYHALIRGGVAYERIGEVYKACEFAITINTITNSPTMFARRVYELLACNTITVSNYCTGVDRAFGDLVVMAGRDDVGRRLVQLRDSRDGRHRLRLRGLREVMSHHTAASRLAQVAAAVLGPVAVEEPRVWVVARVDSSEELDCVVGMFAAQRWERRQLLLVAPESLGRVDARAEGIHVVAAQTAIADFVPENGWVAPWHAGDYYGPCYLLDMMHATRYAGEAVIGKATFFRMAGREPRLEPGGAAYSRSGQLPPRSSVIRRDLLADRTLREVAEVEAWKPDRPGLAIDEFGYCMGGAGEPAASLVDVY